MEIKKSKAKKPFGPKYKTYDTSNGFGNPDQWKEAFEERMNLFTLTTKHREENKSLLDPLHEAFKLKDEKALQKAYRALMIKHHPDKVGDSDQARINAQLINEEYFKLKDKL